MRGWQRPRGCCYHSCIPHGDEMRRMNIFTGLTLLACVLLLGSCSKAQSTHPEPKTNGTPIGASSASEAGFPPVDRRCAQDTDCGTHHRYLTEDGRCCYTCEYRIGSKKWVKAVMAECSKRSLEGCPMRKCVAPPSLKCVAGECTASSRPPAPSPHPLPQSLPRLTHH